MFNTLKKMAGKVMEKFDMVTNEDELAAVVAAAVLVAYADDNISEAEKDTAINAIASHEALGSFTRDKIKALFTSDAKLMDADKELATGVLENKLHGLTDTTARIRALGIAKQIANADGEFSPAEKAVVDRLRKITG